MNIKLTKSILLALEVVNSYLRFNMGRNIAITTAEFQKRVNNHTHLVYITARVQYFHKRDTWITARVSTPDTTEIRMWRHGHVRMHLAVEGGESVVWQAPYLVDDFCNVTIDPNGSTLEPVGWAVSTNTKSGAQDKELTPVYLDGDWDDRPGEGLRYIYWSRGNVVALYQDLSEGHPHPDKRPPGSFGDLYDAGEYLVGNAQDLKLRIYPTKEIAQRHLVGSK